VHALNLSSEATTGLKIPSGQIAGGKFTVAAGDTKDLNIDFNACASIVVQGNGQYRLKPVLHAGEVTTASTSINGKVFDQTTNTPLAGGTVVVALEQQDASGVDRVMMETLTDSTGAFVFCPVAVYLHFSDFCTHYLSSQNHVPRRREPEQYFGRDGLGSVQ
jgi:hypothetical protein